MHDDAKHLPKLQDRDGLACKRHRYIAIDRASRYVHLAVQDDEITASAIDFLDEALAGLPLGVTHVTDHGSCFTTDDFERSCAPPADACVQD